MAGRLETALRASGEDTIIGMVPGYLGGNELLRTLRAHAAEIIFLSFEDAETAQGLVRFLESQSQAAPIIAIHRVCDTKVLREIMLAGVREFVAYPFEPDALRESLRHTAALVKGRAPGDHPAARMVAFVPSKAGVGTSTMALNVSAALARQLGARVLLADLDLHSGMTRFLLKLTNERSVLDAMEHSTHLEPELWGRLVTSVNHLDVLHAGRVTPNLQIEPADVRNLIHFVRLLYSAVCFDLSGNLEKYSLEVMQQSNRVLLVCTPEIPSLHLAREKLQVLRSLNLQDRLGVVLNRVHKRPIFGKQEVEDLLGVPVIASMPNDYHGVERATRAGKVVDPGSELGKEYAAFAAGLVDAPEGASEPKRSYLEYLPSAITALARR